MYRPLFPSHLYPGEMETFFSMLENVKVGGYIDFTAPDLETGKEIKLSEQTSPGLVAGRKDKYPWVNLLELNDQ